MKIKTFLPSLLFLAMSCHSPAVQPEQAPVKAMEMSSADTTKTAATGGSHPENKSAPPTTTHLKDTCYAAGNFILFLRPDDSRYAELEKTDEDGLGDGDADFAVGITATEDSLKQNDRYKGITLLISTNRYIRIEDCQGGPLTIDRDSVNYGYILSGKGRPIAKTYNSVHSGNYLEEIEEYFSLP